MNRAYRQERAFWLDHLYQPAGGRRPDNAGRINLELDVVPIPPPGNLQAGLPLSDDGLLPCLAWRWSLRGNGYAELSGQGAHILAYEQSRGEPVAHDRLVLHHCNRPFCIQPGHLYEGTPQHNAEDRAAVSREIPVYDTWPAVEYHQGRVVNSGLYSWLPPVAPPRSITAMPGTPPIECPHKILNGHCVNCGYGEVFDYRRHCFHSPAVGLWPCRCAETPCPCPSCCADRGELFNR